MANQCRKLLCTALLLLVVAAGAYAQTPIDAVVDVVANSGVFPVGTTVVSVSAMGESVIVDLSPEAVASDFGDALADNMVESICTALGEFPEFTNIEVTVGGQPIWTYLPRPSVEQYAAQSGPGVQSAGMSVQSAINVLSAQDPLLPPAVTPQSSELSGKLVVLHPSHGSFWLAYTSKGVPYNPPYWVRAQRTFSGPNPVTNRPPGIGNYMPSDYYYWTRGFQWPMYYEDDMSPEIIRFLYAYCQSAGAATFCSRNLDKTSGNFDYNAYGYPNCSFQLPKWQCAAKYNLQELGLPSSVWNEPALLRDDDKDVRARPYYANYLMQTLGYTKENSISFSLHSNAATTSSGCPKGSQAQARGTETFWYVLSGDPYGVKNQAIAFCNATEAKLINSIRNQYDGTWAESQYSAVLYPVPQEWCTGYGTYRGYVQDGVANNRWQDRGVKTSNFGEIREAKCPAQLMELVFHDNWKFYPDQAFHQDKIFRATVAWGMYEGFCQYFGVTPKARLAASVDGVNFPTLVGPGAAISGTVTMKNLGQAWCWGNKMDGTSYIPYTVWDLQATVDDQFGAAGTKIAIANDGNYYPGDTAEFAVSLIAPSTTGLYTTSWKMIKDDAKGGSFGDVATAQIQVDADAPEITITSPAAQDYAYGCVSVAFSAADALSQVASLTAEIDGTPVTSGQTVCNLGLGNHTLTVTAADTFGNTATQSVTFNVVNTVGMVSVGGWIELIDKKGTCGFSCAYEAGAPAPTGHLTYQDHDTGMTVQSDAMVAMGIVGNHAWFYGTCTIDGEAGHWFRVDVIDNGEPGSADVFNISLDSGYSQGGTLGGGNVTIH